MVVTSNRIDSKNFPYYVDKYFFANPDAPGMWIGNGCKFLGLEGNITQKPHEQLLEGFSPEGIPLIRNAGPTEGWYGVDFAGNAGKTASILLVAQLKTRPADVSALLVDAARPVIALVEERGAIIRFGRGGVEREQARMIVGAFPQYENREGECHAHVHLIAYRPAFSADGRPGAIDQQSLFQPQLKMAMGALFRAELAYLSEQRFGMRAVRKGFGFEVEGVPQNVVEAMSTRRQAIEAHLSDHGLSTARAAAYATLATRTAKVHVPLPELLAGWESQFRDLGFGPDEVARCLNQCPTHTGSLEFREGMVLKVAVQRLTQHKDNFNDLDLIRFVAEEAQGRGLSAAMVLQTVDRAIEQSPQIVRLGQPGERPLFSTPEIMALEKRFIAEAQHAQLDHSQMVSSQTVDKVLALYPQLSDEQRAAARYLTERPGAVQIVSGWPGTGKTTLLRACREMWEMEGFSVRGATLSGKAAVGLTNEAGIQSDTVEMTLIRLRDDSARRQRGEPPSFGVDQKTILVVDEAATCGTRQLAELQREMRARGGKIILSGDPRQTQSIEFGGAMAGLAKRLGQIELTEIRRQEEPWARDAVKAFGEGDAAAALRSYAERGLVIVAPNRAEALERMVGDWAKQGIEAPADNLMLTATRAEAQRANRRAQEMRRDAGALLGEGIETNGVQIYVNDRVMFERNSRPLGVRNGQLGTVVDFRVAEGTMVVEIDEGSRVVIPFNDYPHVALGYGLTTHKAQGVTVSRAFCLISERPDRELAVVQSSRHRESCKFYVDQFTAGDDLAELSKAMARSHQQAMAHDVATRSPSYVVLQPEFQR